MDKGKKVIVKTLYEMAKEERNKILQNQYMKAMGTLVKNEPENEVDFAGK